MKTPVVLTEQQKPDMAGMYANGASLQQCGERVKKSLSVRTHVCPSCGYVADRDENAALDILRAGQARQARTWPSAASVA